jgi:group II intron reverse transcriptase/maturase
MAAEAESEEIAMRLTPPEKVQKLQAALHAKAKRVPGYRFYALYDKVWRADVLAFAYQRCRANGGAAGVDGQTFEAIEAYGEERWLGELTEELRQRTYRPQAVQRVWRAKPDGGRRPLGVPTIRDRVVQMAVVLVLEPIFEADLPPEQYAYRENRSAHAAVQHVLRLVRNGHTEVVDADLSGYFDSIPHAELMKSLARRISDGLLLHLIKMWLEAAVEETDERGHCQRTTRNRDEHRGTPQGAVISPLLANIYMRRFVLGWRKLGHAQRLNAVIVNYADDFVICCRGTAAQALAAMQDMMAKLKLTVNPRKTRVCRLPEEAFDFLGFTFLRRYDPRNGRAFLGVRPSAKAVRKMHATVQKITDRKQYGQAFGVVLTALNRALLGWGGYFRLGSYHRTFRAVDWYVRSKFRQWWHGKLQHPRQKARLLPAAELYGLGLVRLQP